MAASIITSSHAAYSPQDLCPSLAKSLATNLGTFPAKHTNFPSALYGEKCSESVIPASRVPFPLAVAMFANMLKVPLRQLVINRVQREKNRTRTAARLRTITSCHQVNCQLLAWLEGIMSGYISTGRGDTNYMCDCWLRWGPYRDLIGLHGGCRGAGEGSW